MRPLPNTRPALQQLLISAVGQLARYSLPVIIYTFKQYHHSTRKQQKNCPFSWQYFSVYEYFWPIDARNLLKWHYRIFWTFYEVTLRIFNTGCIAYKITLHQTCNAGLLCPQNWNKLKSNRNKNAETFHSCFIVIVLFFCVQSATTIIVWTSICLSTP